MKRLLRPTPFRVIVLAIAVLIGGTPRPVSAESPVKMKKFLGAIDVTAEGVTPFALTGTASHLGDFNAYGEVEFVQGEEPGSLLGKGVVVFEAANGDLLVGVTTWEVAPGGDYRASRIHFSWRDAVEFSDGTVVANTGRFVDDRPPGLVLISIIGILVGLLLPAINPA
jgi:hypothetical protein